MRKQADIAHEAGLCPKTLEKVAMLVRTEADRYGELAETRASLLGSASASVTAANADAQSCALHQLARVLEYMAVSRAGARW